MTEEVEARKTVDGVIDQVGINHHSRFPVITPLFMYIGGLWYRIFHIGFPDLSRITGWLAISSYSGQLVWHFTFSTRESAAAFRLRRGGSMFAKTGRHGRGVGRRVQSGV